MLEDAIDNAESDVDERLLVETTQEALQVLAALEKSLAQDQRWLPPRKPLKRRTLLSACALPCEQADRSHLITYP